MSRSWRLFLQDMIEFCQRVISYADGLSREAIEAESIRYDAILRNLELVGEAARNVPPMIRAEAPEIPWRDIVNTRNVYFGVDKEIVWNVVSVEVPWLLERLVDRTPQAQHHHLRS